MSRVLAVTGLNREAKIVAGPGVVTLASGSVIATLADHIEAALTPDIAGIISIGIAGALDPSLKVGDIIIAIGVRAGSFPLEGQRTVDQIWAERLTQALPTARQGLILGFDRMVLLGSEKAGLHAETSALCIDMESHVAARVSAERGLPFAAVRVISDSAANDLPSAVLSGMRPDGGMNLPGVLAALALHPSQLPALMRVGRDAETAFKALAAARAALGSNLGYSAA